MQAYKSEEQHNALIKTYAIYCNKYICLDKKKNLVYYSSQMFSENNNNDAKETRV